MWAISRRRNHHGNLHSFTMLIGCKSVAEYGKYLSVKLSLNANRPNKCMIVTTCAIHEVYITMLSYTCKSPITISPKIK
jgi:hypothetical protein